MLQLTLKKFSRRRIKPSKTKLVGQPGQTRYKLLKK